MQPHLGVRFAIELLDADQLEGRRSLDGAQPVGEGEEAIQIIVEVIVDDDGVATSRQDEVATPVAVAVGTRSAMFVVVAAAMLLFGSVVITMTVVDAGSQILAVKAVAEIGLINLLVVGAGASRVVSVLMQKLTHWNLKAPFAKFLKVYQACQSI